MKNIFSVWEGVFENFTEAGGDPDAFDSDIWIQKQGKKIEKSYKNYLNRNTVSKDYPLPLVVAMLLLEQEKLSILDFGGGMGIQYLDIISKVHDAEKAVKFTIVDGASTLKNVPGFMRKFKNLSYEEDLKNVHGNFDIIHIGSTLQYIEDWKTLLEHFKNKYNPTYFVFSDLMAGDIPSFVSHQIFYDKRIPHHFLNKDGFQTTLESMSFKKIYESKFRHDILDQEEVFPNSALPESHKISRSIHMVFRKV